LQAFHGVVELDGHLVSAVEQHHITPLLFLIKENLQWEVFPYRTHSIVDVLLYEILRNEHAFATSPRKGIVLSVACVTKCAKVKETSFVHHEFLFSIESVPVGYR
jgi:hypothetical protein